MTEQVVLGFLEKNEEISDSRVFAEEDKINHDELENIIKSLKAHERVDFKLTNQDRWELTDEGKNYAESGSPEACKNKWVEVKKIGKIQEKFQTLRKIELRRIFPVLEPTQKLVELKRSVVYNVRKGSKYTPTMKKVTTDLTRENIANWKELVLKEYNFKANGSTIQCGHLHPLNKCVHETGGYGSRGYWYDLDPEEANKNLLRTHTTAVIAKKLYQLAQMKQISFDSISKYYSVDRLFMNESVDRTHLAEFHQIEGVICGKGLSLGHLLGVLEEFFSRMGMSSKLRFKPAFNSYMEPNMEIFSYHEGFKKWVEVGNSGMFRPEMLRSMGFPEDVRAIAWGLSLDRPTMIRYGVHNIRDMFGHKVDLKLIEKNPICSIRLQGTDPDAYDLNFLVQTY
ncbi:OLC1v1004526C1 [Oldenlandia corymbosa var. corymbosa]|uniref:phenylalanine--tRNA ligase n=1 Tax=Oldenlandia corymbosa var. corymbosa TaxID=529605 RepID=A0AAV1DD70_OLDCO|nr:OLC1v1004526C1 [Oldenlandia corymbosa var. corymbosa]